MSFVVGATYTFSLMTSKFAVEYNPDVPGGRVTRAPLDGGIRQQWTIIGAGNDTYFIKHATGVYMSGDHGESEVICSTTAYEWKIREHQLDPSYNILVGSHINRAAVVNQQRAFFEINTSTAEQGWKFNLVREPGKPSSAGVYDAAAYFLSNRATSTLATAAAENNKPVTGSGRLDVSNQMWFNEAVDKSKNLFYIRSAKKGYLSTASSPPASLAPILSNTEKKQIWELRPDPTDPYLIRIYVPGTDLAIDLSGGSAANGAAIILYPTQNPGPNQQWKIVPTQ